MRDCSGSAMIRSMQGSAAAVRVTGITVVGITTTRMTVTVEMTVALVVMAVMAVVAGMAVGEKAGKMA